MKSLTTAAVTLVVLATLSACGSDDDDTAPPTVTDDASGANEGGTSTFNPDLDDPGARGEPSSEPGDDTGAIAGLWDAGTATDERYVLIAGNGLYTDYDLQQDTVGDGRNCHLVVGPRTITLEDASTNAYSLSDNRSFTATRSADGRVLTITFADDDETTGSDETVADWLLVEEQLADDLPRCEGDAPGDG